MKYSIISAEIGETIGLYALGFNLHGVIIAYVLGFAIAGFSTFMTILGRYDFYNYDHTTKAGVVALFLKKTLTEVLYLIWHPHFQIYDSS